MPKMSDVQLIQQMEQPVLSIRTTAKVQDLPQLIGESYGKLGAYLNELGEMLTDVPYVLYHNMDMQNLDVEMGFPVSKLLPAKGDIRSATTPSGKAVFCMYRGAYTEIEPVYEEMAKWITDNGFEAKGTSYEYYYNGTEYPESELLTKIVMPIK